jgi:hypothetical protein
MKSVGAMGKSICFLFLWLICSAIACAQTRASAQCVLDTAMDGKTITVVGEAVQEPHDLGFRVIGCADLVILAYAGDQDTDMTAAQLRRDKKFKQFQKYTSAVYKGDKENICLECPQYSGVKATLSGKLEIASIPTGTTKDDMGLLHDASGRVVGTSGFGHPTRIFKYRLVVFSVVDVQARKLQKWKSPAQQSE